MGVARTRESWSRPVSGTLGHTSHEQYTRPGEGAGCGEGMDRLEEMGLTWGVNERGYSAC